MAFYQAFVDQWCERVGIRFVRQHGRHRAVRVKRNSGRRQGAQGGPGDGSSADADADGGGGELGSGAALTALRRQQEIRYIKLFAATLAGGVDDINKPTFEDRLRYCHTASVHNQSRRISLTLAPPVTALLLQLRLLLILTALRCAIHSQQGSCH